MLRNASRGSRRCMYAIEGLADLGIGELSSTAEIADREMSVLWSWSRAAREQGGGVRTGRRLSWPRGGCLALILAQYVWATRVATVPDAYCHVGTTYRRLPFVCISRECTAAFHQGVTCMGQ